MKNKTNIVLLFLFLLTTFSCSKMNDKHDLYLQGGEIIYIGRVDSARILPGENRFLLRYWITDNRAKELKVYWNQMADSLIIDIPHHEPSDSIDYIIGNNTNVIPEGNYTFQIVSDDGDGLESIIFEKMGNVYGELFYQLMTDRFVKSTGYNPVSKNISIEWGEPSSSKDIGVELTYYAEDTKKTVQFLTKELESQTLLENIDVEKGVTYRTMFLPEPMAIDTFFTAPLTLNIINNVALNKPVKTSSNLNDTYSGKNAVDNIISSDSRWISSSSDTEHWIEVDLEKEYILNSFKLHKHIYGNYLLQHFIFQVNKNGEWVDLVNVENNLEEVYESIFIDEVVTDKVRIFIPSYINNMARIYEFYVYVKY